MKSSSIAAPVGTVLSMRIVLLSNNPNGLCGYSKLLLWKSRGSGGFSVNKIEVTLKVIVAVDDEHEPLQHVGDIVEVVRKTLPEAQVNAVSCDFPKRCETNCPYCPST